MDARAENRGCGTRRHDRHPAPPNRRNARGMYSDGQSLRDRCLREPHDPAVVGDEPFAGAGHRGSDGAGNGRTTTEVTRPQRRKAPRVRLSGRPDELANESVSYRVNTAIADQDHRPISGHENVSDAAGIHRRRGTWLRGDGACPTPREAAQEAVWRHGPGRVLRVVEDHSTAGCRRNGVQALQRGGERWSRSRRTLMAGPRDGPHQSIGRLPPHHRCRRV